jgi:hypothetical protein
MAITFIIGFSINTSAQNTTIDYQEVLRNLKSQKASSINNEVSSQLLFKTLVDSIFPAWYGTPWDFNGISNTPGKGEIACGYFVSTTLKHAGFNLNRYKLAQQASEIITKSVCGAEKTRYFHDIDDIINLLSLQNQGLYIVGLDYHVGFIVIENGGLYFVHSDFINNKVVREPLRTSEAFSSSQGFVLGEITHNQSLMKKWKSGTVIY